MANIIHNPGELMDLDRDTLDEILLEEYKNPALLRELLRITLYKLRDQTKLAIFYKDRKNDTLDKLDNMKEDMNKLFEKYR